MGTQYVDDHRFLLCKGSTVTDITRAVSQPDFPQIKPRSLEDDVVCLRCAGCLRRVVCLRHAVCLCRAVCLCCVG